MIRIALLTSLVLDQTGDSIILDPFQALKDRIPKKSESSWILDIYKQWPENTAFLNPTRDDINSGLQGAQALYLEMDYLNVIEECERLERLVINRLPYPEIRSDLKQILVLKSMALMSSESPAPKIEIGPFCEDTDFFEAFPTKFRNSIQDLCHSLAPRSLKKIPNALYHGALTLKGKAGRYFLHVLESGKLKAQFCDTECKTIWERNFWTSLTSASLKNIVLKSKPLEISYANLSLLGDPKGMPILIDTKESLQKNLDIPRSETADSSIFSSPWFWFGTTIVLGLTGFLTYDHVREKEVTTP